MPDPRAHLLDGETYVRNKAAKWVFEALLQVRRVFPLPILGIDSDNGSEFTNERLLQYFAEQEIIFSRLC